MMRQRQASSQIDVLWLEGEHVTLIYEPSNRSFVKVGASKVCPNVTLNSPGFHASRLQQA